jgi:tRNA A-37 threonylcarbamoyl transferase component Bud32
LREDALERFEAAWQSGSAPAIAAFLPPVQVGSSPGTDAGCRELFHELVKIDLEYRWKVANRNGPADLGALPRCPRLEHYVELLPGLGGLADLPIDVVGEEYRVRQRWGDRPDHAEYVARFPAFATELPRELGEVDAELADERAVPTVRSRVPAPKTSVLRCPHCRHSIDVAAGPPPRDFACPACGGAFQIEPLPAAPGRRVQPPFARLGRYELGELLGAGTFGSVWRTRDTELKREVALKLPRLGQPLTPAEEERFLREARSAARLQHPGIVAVHDVGYEHGTLFLVSELIHGESLDKWLKRRRLSFREAAQLIADVADALDFAHQQGVVHRDVKPSNIMLENVGSQLSVVSGNEVEMRQTTRLTTDYGLLTPRLMDFGLALRNAAEVTMTLDGQVLGTPAYISPEQLRNPHIVDGRSDVYSLGVILYELLTGELPFRGTTHALLDQVMSDEPQAPRRLNERIPRDLETICLECLSKEPAGRYQTASALAADLHRWLDARPIAARPVGWFGRLWLWMRRHPIPAVTVGATAFALAIVVGLSTSLVVATLLVATIVALIAALHYHRKATELAIAVEMAEANQQKTAAALHSALEQCFQACVERDRALAGQSQAGRRFNLQHGLAKAWIFDLPATLSQSASPTAARALLVRTAVTYLDGLAKEAGDDSLLQRELAVAYGRVGDLQAESLPGRPGDVVGALASHRKSLALFTVIARAQPDNAQAERDRAAAAATASEIERALSRVQMDAEAIRS